jgi:hypothetical protein
MNSDLFSPFRSQARFISKRRGAVLVGNEFRPILTSRSQARFISKGWGAVLVGNEFGHILSVSLAGSRLLLTRGINLKTNQILPGVSEYHRQVGWRTQGLGATRGYRIKVISP